MKVSYFHLMPYQDLPRDFESKYRSAWVDLPNEHFDSAKGGQYYKDYLAQLQHADQLGFDGICVNEHHGNAYGLMPSPNLMASILTQTTSDAALIVLGNSLALYQPPLRVAEEMAMLDIMSGGRLVAGFPVGDFHGHDILLWTSPVATAGTPRRGTRPDYEVVVGEETIRLQWEVHQAAVRERLAPTPTEASPTGLDTGKREFGDVGLGA